MKVRCRAWWSGIGCRIWRYAKSDAPSKFRQEQSIVKSLGVGLIHMIVDKTLRSSRICNIKEEGLWWHVDTLQHWKMEQYAVNQCFAQVHTKLSEVCDEEHQHSLENLRQAKMQIKALNLKVSSLEQELLQANKTPVKAVHENGINVLLSFKESVMSMLMLMYSSMSMIML